MNVELSDKDLLIGQLQLGKHPAVIAVDFSNGFTSEESPLGGDFSAQIEANFELLELAEEKHLPIFFTTVVYDNAEQASVFRQRLPALNILQRGSDWVDIHARFAKFVSPERIIEKHHPSGFFNTPLAERLHALNVDSLIITGLTTSGCVRATCVDGLQHNFSCTVVPEACGDRNEAAHEMNLHDLHAKYAQVTPLEEVKQQISAL